MKAPDCRSKLSVLLVEDSTPDANLVREALASSGASSGPRIELNRVSTLAAGLENLAGKEFDAVLLDLGLPDAMGMDCLDRMLEQHTDLPVVVLTGLDDDEAAQEAMRHGAQDYLVKGRWGGYHLERAISHAVERKRNEERIRRFGFRDELTGLANRAFLLDQIRRCIARRARDPSRSFAVVLIDVDKSVGQPLGRPIGDAVLIGVAERLRRCVRSPDTVARVGGHEFALLLEETGGTRGVLRVVERVHDAMRAPFDHEGHEVFSSVTTGVAVLSSSTAEPDEILRQADVALDRAKAHESPSVRSPSRKSRALDLDGAVDECARTAFLESQGEGGSNSPSERSRDVPEPFVSWAKDAVRAAVEAATEKELRSWTRSISSRGLGHALALSLGGFGDGLEAAGLPRPSGLPVMSGDERLV